MFFFCQYQGEVTIPELSPSATDVPGSFRSFAVLTRSGNVFYQAMHQRLNTVLQSHTTDNSYIFTSIPALQHSSIIQLAFGDCHFHALYSQDHITSDGTEAQFCGALGLGGHGDGEGRLRGIRDQCIEGDRRLITHAHTEGRRV